MKTTYFVLLMAVLSLLITLTGCSEKTAKEVGKVQEKEAVYIEDVSYQAIQNTLLESEAVCGIAYIGSGVNSEESDLDGQVKAVSAFSNTTFSFANTEDIRTVNGSGEELFLVIPKSGTAVEVYSTELDEDGSTVRNDKIAAVEDEPFFLICNSSDIYSNVEIEVSDNGSISTYSPFVSLKDGHVQLPSTGFADCTTYSDEE